MTSVAEKKDSLVWVQALDVNVLNDDLTFNACLRKVSSYRREKVMRYRFRRDRNLSLGAGLLLDALLGRYGLREKQMEYEMNEFGKPCLKGFPDIHFNLSHAGDYAVCALGNIPLGIDIEPIRPFDREVAACCMSSEELSFLSRLSQWEQAKTFTRLWTLKESFLKTTGSGLSGGHFPSFNIRSGGIVPSYKNYLFHEFLHPGYSISLCMPCARAIPSPEMEWLTII